MLIWKPDETPPAAETPAGERRATERFTLRLPGLLRCKRGQWEVWTINLSMGGVLLETQAPLQVGEACELWLFTADTEVSARAQVVRVQRGQIALAFAGNITSLPLG